MGHDHGHQHGHDHLATSDASVRALAIVVVLLVAFMVAQLAGGLVARSLALISDAGHMATDALGVGLALVAMVVARRRSGSRQHTYGLHRLEILAALANAALLCAIGVYVVVESVTRLGGSEPVDTTTVLVVGSAGLAVNLIAFAVLRPRSQENLNLQGAYLEVLADLLGSVGVIVSAVVVRVTQWGWVDPVTALAIGAVVMPRALRLGARAIRVLLEVAPSHLDVGDVETALRAVPGVVDLHDLHVWTLTAHRELVTAHLVVEDGHRSASALEAATRVLRERFGIDHATLQVESRDREGCHDADW